MQSCHPTGFIGRSHNRRLLIERSASSSQFINLTPNRTSRRVDLSDTFELESLTFKVHWKQSRPFADSLEHQLDFRDQQEINLVAVWEATSGEAILKAFAGKPPGTTFQTLKESSRETIWRNHSKKLFWRKLTGWMVVTAKIRRLWNAWTTDRSHKANV